MPTIAAARVTDPANAQGSSRLRSRTHPPGHYCSEVPESEGQERNERDPVEVARHQRDIRNDDHHRKRKSSGERGGDCLQKGDDPPAADERLVVGKAPDFGARHGRAYPDR